MQGLYRWFIEYGTPTDLGLSSNSKEFNNIVCDICVFILAKGIWRFQLLNYRATDSRSHSVGKEWLSLSIFVSCLTLRFVYLNLLDTINIRVSLGSEEIVIFLARSHQRKLYANSHVSRISNVDCNHGYESGPLSTSSTVPSDVISAVVNSVINAPPSFCKIVIMFISLCL